MNVLLDTHALIWYQQTHPRMSATALRVVRDPSNRVFVSPASHWEIAIKLGTGKLTLADPFLDFVQFAIFDNGFTILPVEPRHSAALVTLPHHHRDPFDRMIIAQAIVEGMSVVGNDVAFDAYPVQRLW